MKNRALSSFCHLEEDARAEGLDTMSDSCFDGLVVFTDCENHEICFVTLIQCGTREAQVERMVCVETRMAGFLIVACRKAATMNMLGG